MTTTQNSEGGPVARPSAEVTRPAKAPDEEPASPAVVPVSDEVRSARRNGRRRSEAEPAQRAGAEADTPAGDMAVDTSAADTPVVPVSDEVRSARRNGRRRSGAEPAQRAAAAGDTPAGDMAVDTPMDALAKMVPAREPAAEAEARKAIEAAEGKAREIIEAAEGKARETVKAAEAEKASARDAGDEARSAKKRYEVMEAQSETALRITEGLKSDLRSATRRAEAREEAAQKAEADAAASKQRWDAKVGRATRKGRVSIAAKVVGGGIAIVTAVASFLLYQEERETHARDRKDAAARLVASRYVALPDRADLTGGEVDGNVEEALDMYGKADVVMNYQFLTHGGLGYDDLQQGITANCWTPECLNVVVEREDQVIFKTLYLELTNTGSYAATDIELKLWPYMASPQEVENFDGAFGERLQGAEPLTLDGDDLPAVVAGDGRVLVPVAVLAVFAPSGSYTFIAIGETRKPFSMCWRNDGGERRCERVRGPREVIGTSGVDIMVGGGG